MGGRLLYRLWTEIGYTFIHITFESNSAFTDIQEINNPTCVGYNLNPGTASVNTPRKNKKKESLLTPREINSTERRKTSLNPLGSLLLMLTKILLSLKEECHLPSIPCMDTLKTIYSIYLNFHTHFLRLKRCVHHIKTQRSRTKCLFCLFL